MNYKSTFSLMSMVFFTALLQATIVVPFDHLGHLSQSSDDVIIAKVMAVTEPNGEEYMHYSWDLKIKNSFFNKFDPGEILTLNSEGGRSAEMVNAIVGDINLEVGETYLIFLDQNIHGSWKPQTLSYYLYKLEIAFGSSYFVPVREGLDIHIEGEEDGIFVMEAGQFSAYLNMHISESFSKTWNDDFIRADKEISDFYSDGRAAPGHCTFLNFGGTGIRWNIFPSSPLNIYCDTEQDAGLPSSHTEVGNAITDMSTSYLGTNLVNSGIVTTNYNPDCSGGAAQGGNFLSYTNGLNGGDCVLVIFNDPCSQITDLSGCSGTLAVGGLYGYTPFHTFDGQSWYTGGNGYVIVNNGTGGCLSAAQFKIMLTHELTHSLGVGHIAGTNTANMNPSCCINITSLDEQCLDYTYPPIPLPVELISFKGNSTERGNELLWSTSSELDSESFEIEKSTDGRTFGYLASIPAKGFSAEVVNYNYMDEALANSTLYYRLKQVDYDGKYEYSEVIAIEAIGNPHSFAVYPNPANELLKITMPTEGINAVNIFNSTGEIVYSAVNVVLEEIDISQFPKGIYFINFESNKDTVSKALSFVKN